MNKAIYISIYIYIYIYIYIEVDEKFDEFHWKINNIFEFDEKTFKQKGETAIGTAICTILCYPFYGWSRGKSVWNFWKKNNDLMEVHR